MESSRFYADSEGLDKTAQWRSLIRTFGVRLRKLTDTLDKLPKSKDPDNTVRMRTMIRIWAFWLFSSTFVLTRCGTINIGWTNLVSLWYNWPQHTFSLRDDNFFSDLCFTNVHLKGQTNRSVKPYLPKIFRQSGESKQRRRRLRLSSGGPFHTMTRSHPSNIWKHNQEEKGMLKY